MKLNYIAGAVAHVKPEKPRADFPLWPHPLGYWAKKINGQLETFGRWGHIKNGQMVYLPYVESYQAAIKDYKARYDEDTNTLVEPAKAAVTLKDLCNRYLAAKHKKAKAGYLTRSYVREQEGVCRRLMEVLGTKIPVERLGPDDFEKVLASLVERFKAVTLGIEITWIKAIFKYGVANRIIQPVYFGSEFKPPDRVAVKKYKKSRPKREFSTDELRLFLANATPILKAPILLAINSGIGNADIARLQRHHINFETGWLDFARGKTEVDRHIPLWPETAEALQAAWANRPEPYNDAEAETVLLTDDGRNLLRQTEGGRTDVVMKQFRRLLNKLKIKRKGVGFYALRHTFATLALESRDRDAVRHLMGHAAGDMLSVYDEGRPSDLRLKAVTNHVRAVILGGVVLEGGEL